MRVAVATAKMIPRPTVTPNAEEVFNSVSAKNTIAAPQIVPKIIPLASPTYISLLRTLFKLSLWISPVARPRTITVAP